MPTRVEHDRAHDRLHVLLQERIIVEGEWLSQRCEIGLAADRSVVELCFYGYYTEPKEWPLTEETVKKYHLEEFLDDLRMVWENFFSPPNFAVKSIHYEGPDGEEIIVRPGQQTPE